MLLEPSAVPIWSAKGKYKHHEIKQRTEAIPVHRKGSMDRASTNFKAVPKKGGHASTKRGGWGSYKDDIDYIPCGSLDSGDPNYDEEEDRKQYYFGNFDASDSEAGTPSSINSEEWVHNFDV